MVGLTFVGFIGAQLVLRDRTVSLIFGGICIARMILRELYLHWMFGGAPPLSEQQEKKPTFRGIVVHLLFVMVVWLIPDISDGRLSPVSMIGSLLSGGGVAAYLWWQRNYSAEKR